MKIPKGMAFRWALALLSAISAILVLALRLQPLPAWAASVADLELTKTVSDPIVYEGELVVYTVTVINRGPEEVTRVMVAERLSEGVSWVWHLASQGVYDNVHGLWEVGRLAPGKCATLEITVRIGRGTAGMVLTGVAEITAADQPDPDSIPGNARPEEDDQASAEVTVPRPEAVLAGSLGISSTIRPQTTGAEVSNFLFDPLAEAGFNLTLSGLTLASLTRLGLAGLEYQALTLRAVLGLTRLTGHLFFAPSGTEGLSFSRQSLTLDGQLNGLRWRSLATWTPGPPARFEVTLTATGSIANGAAVTSEVQLCLDAGCVAGLSYGRLTISGLTLAGIAIRSVTTFRPALPFEKRLFLQFPLWERATVDAFLRLWPKFDLSSTVRASDGGWSLVLHYDSHFKLTRATAAALLPLTERLSLRTLTSLTPGVGIDKTLSLTLRLGDHWLSNTTTFRRLKFQMTRFSLTSRFPGASFTLAAQFELQRLSYISVGLRVSF